MRLVETYGVYAWAMKWYSAHKTLSLIGHHIVYLNGAIVIYKTCQFITLQGNIIENAYHKSSILFFSEKPTTLRD